MWGGGEYELRIINYELRITIYEFCFRNFKYTDLMNGCLL